MNIVYIAIFTMMSIMIVPIGLSSGIFDVISGVVSSIPKKNALSFEEINKQLTEIENKLKEQTETLQDQNQSLNTYLMQVIDGQKETNKAEETLQKSNALPLRVHKPLSKALRLQQSVLENTKSILEDGKNLIDQIVNNRAPAVQKALSRVRSIAKKGKSVSKLSRDQSPEKVISGIFRNLF